MAKISAASASGGAGEAAESGKHQRQAINGNSSGSQHQNIQQVMWRKSLHRMTVMAKYRRSRRNISVASGMAKWRNGEMAAK
jgi:hypothetical protein